MQWEKPYYIDTNVSSRKSATTFGDLPDCLVNFFEHYLSKMRRSKIYIHNAAIPCRVLLKIEGYS